MSTERKHVLSWTAGRAPVEKPDLLAVEEPLEIQIDTRPVCVTMRTPGHDEELAAGFAVSEALVRRRADVQKIAPYPRNARGNVVGIFLSPKVRPDLTRLTRHVFTSSSCGLCGKASIEAVHGHFRPVSARLRVAATTVLALPGKLRRRQETFAHTGGLHAAALFDPHGRLVVLREDVGRHNAVDKVLGYGFLRGRLPFAQHLLLVSGRASFEIMQKALAARIPIVCAVSAPSSLAVEFAQANRQTLVGFLRDGRMNVYTGTERIRFPAVRDC